MSVFVGAQPPCIATGGTYVPAFHGRVRRDRRVSEQRIPYRGGTPGEGGWTSTSKAARGILRAGRDGGEGRCDVKAVPEPAESSVNRRNPFRNAPKTGQPGPERRSWPLLAPVRDIRPRFRFRYRKVWRFESSLVHELKIIRVSRRAARCPQSRGTGFATIQTSGRAGRGSRGGSR